MQFEENVHLAAIGGGLLRTPYLSATQDPPANLQAGTCPVLSPEILHIPAAGRKSGLNLHDPSFRRAVITSTLGKLITRDGAAAANQQHSGATFGFSQSPDRNHAHVRLSDGLLMFNERVMVLDSTIIIAGRPIDLNVVSPSLMTTGFLAFITRYWEKLRHVDAEILAKHTLPLQFDCDFDAIPFLNKTFRAYLPILGNIGDVKVYDARLGIQSWDPGGSDLSGLGTATVITDGIGGWLIDIEITNFNTSVLPLAIADASGQVYCRNLLIQDSYPTGTFVRMPAGVVGIPYRCSIPTPETYCVGPDETCPSEEFTRTLVLPAGLHVNGERGTIEGIPTEYGTNFGSHDQSIPESGVLPPMGWYLTINRPPRNLLTIVDIEETDRSTGEYYSAQFMPFGSTLAYGGHVFEFHRWLSVTQPWPGIREIPFAYGVGGPQPAKELENVWRYTP